MTTIERGAATEMPLAAGTVPEAFQRTVALHAERPALRTLGDGFRLTWRQLDRRVRSVAAGLAGIGVRHGDPVAIMLPNTPEGHIVDYAASHLGAVPFAIFNSSAPEQIAHQLRSSGARVVVSQQDYLLRVATAVDALSGQVEQVVVVDGTATPGPTGTLTTKTLATIEAAGDPSLDLDAIWRAIRPDDIATIIYTSGTTGPPKGAQWSHRGVMGAQRALDHALPMPTDGVVSFLPMAHAGGRITVHYIALANGATITACPDIQALPRHLADARPDAFISTPRFWEKIKDGITAMIAGDPRARSALDEGLRRIASQRSGDPVTVPDALRNYLRELGLDNIKAAFVGGAPASLEVVHFFRAVGVPLLEAYGSTEVGLNIFNRVEDYRAGTAGKPLPGVEIRLLDDGELLCRSEFNMVGYRGEPEQTALTIDADGWLHTGDIARVDDDGFVTIVDRKKELIITSSGKNISPVNIERTIAAETDLIGQIIAIGDQRRYVTALLTLDPGTTAAFARAHGLDDTTHAEIASSPTMVAHLRSVIERASQRLSGPERVRRFAVLPDVWQPDGEELTPTGKLKRRAIAAKYAEVIETLYPV